MIARPDEWVLGGTVMREAKQKNIPSLPLMKQTDFETACFMQMPRWLFSDPRYAELNLEAKVVYTFLLNRFQLSRRNGWINERGEVFVIFPRLELAKELRIGEKRVSTAFKALVEMNLVWEERRGLGIPNKIYLTKVEPVSDPDYECAPFFNPGHEFDEVTDAEPDHSGDADMAVQEPPKRRFWDRQNGGSGADETAVLEPPNPPSSNIYKKNKYLSQHTVSQSVSAAGADGRADDAEETELMDILDACELSYFQPETAKVFENAIERLFYSDSFRVGNATLPQSRVRHKLHQLDYMILRDAESKLAKNTDKDIKNSTAYTMAAIFNSIAESESDLMVDPYLNSLRTRDRASDRR